MSHFRIRGERKLMIMLDNTGSWFPFDKDKVKFERECQNLMPESDDSCLHNQCKKCKGTGMKENGKACVHMISCTCPKCSPFCMGGP